MTTSENLSVRLIKKYPNRRLYDTKTSSYVKLSDIKILVHSNIEFKVIDAKTNEDLTRNILLQIILEEETNGEHFFSNSVLSQIIRNYGHTMQGMFSAYLEKNIEVFLDMQKKMSENSQNFVDQKTFNPEMWSQYMTFQAPMMQGMMNNYIEQSKSLFLQMQEQMETQTKNVFGFPFGGISQDDKK